MQKIKIGILREGKQPLDRRSPFSPEQCLQIEEEFPLVKIFVQPSNHRCFSDDEYRKIGVKMKEDLSDCDILMGIKEVPYDELIFGKKYLFFSHTIKQQQHNVKLMRALINKKIEMIDYECLTTPNFNRIIGFGHYAGIVGAYNGIFAYGKKYDLFSLKRANDCVDRKELNKEFEKVKLPNVKIIVTGNGRVSNGAVELLGALGIRRITPFEFTHYSFREPTYTQLHSYDYNEKKSGEAWVTEDFYENPRDFKSTFSKYTTHCDLLIHCSYWNPKAPILFSKEEMKSPNFRISVIADVTCDINGSIPSTHCSTTISEPFFGYNPKTESEGDAFSTETITVMAVDNLPCELPRDASSDFGKELIDKVLPSLLVDDSDQLIERATICKNGKLLSRFEYLREYAGLKVIELN